MTASVSREHNSHMVDTPSTSTQKIISVGLILVVAAGVVWYISKDKIATCALGSAGVVAIVQGVTHGDAATKILASAAVPLACGAVVKTLTSDPSAEVKLEVQASTGTTAQTVSGSTIAEPAPPPSSSDFGRLLNCIESFGESNFLVDLCRRGIIDPR